MIDDLITPVQASATPLCYLDDVVVGVFDKIWPFIGIAILAMFLYGGAMWMLSTGDPQKVSKATGTLLWAFVGAVILVLVMVIMGTFETILGLPAGSLSVFDIPCS
jgi:hypothetical protein